MKEEKKKKGIPVYKPLTFGTTKTEIYSVPKGYILEIDSLMIQKDGTAGTVTLTDEGTYKDGTTPYTSTVHEQYFAANGNDNVREIQERVFGTLYGVCDTGQATVIVRGRLI